MTSTYIVEGEGRRVMLICPTYVLFLLHTAECTYLCEYQLFVMSNYDSESFTEFYLLK